MSFGDTFTRFRTEQASDAQPLKPTTLEDVQAVLSGMQTMKSTSKLRIQKVLESFKQYTRVVEVLVNKTEVAAIVWGALKLIMQMTSRRSDF